jgi:CheY-like chemotaxis protein
MAARTHNPVVLVVEDDPAVRELIADVLDEVDFEAVAVADGSTALLTMQTLHVDLITLDLDLPGLSGSELLRIIHERKHPAPPVIVITSSAPISRELQVKAQGTLTKPFDVDDLIGMIRDLLPERSGK